ncbi:alanyl-trna synthetase [Ophiostoma piceae UAMH 11346]|uniref:Alanyl-trna synthetase n=1 Tax=Ophiostoma piceae (strain UAMH 11346) TaxID=1262450 RepID=S3CP93_OPHP1|nr:alanyl-trna synthetase [Ophiostoma piceae UAMH 11346]
MITDLVYQVDAKQTTLDTVVEAVVPYSELPSANRALYKLPPDAGDDAAKNLYAVATHATIFHPQGGGQPSDVGTMAVGDTAFDVLSARMDAVQAGRVFHFGRPVDVSNTTDFADIFNVGSTVTQSIDVEKRLLYSRLHTAGHVLGAAVRHTVEKEVPGFDELKASHFPDAASCEFRGKIEGSWKEPIQERVNKYVSDSMPVEIDWWDAAEFRRQGLERLIPQMPAGVTPTGVDNEKWRVVRIVGAEVYPCGGTHVDTTAECGATTVTKISRSKGISRVSYALK